MTSDSTLAEIDLQRRYYADTAPAYDAMHLNDEDQHTFALQFLIGALDRLNVKSVLDCGAGTGRAIRQIKKVRPDIVIRGVEPVAELREVAHHNGIGREELVAGDATALAFADGEFDLVCAFGILHHIKRPERAVAEMLRVGKKAIFISDSNNFGAGSPAARTLKQAFNFLHLWPLVDLVKTRGRGYTVSEGDGLFYSYSVFNNYRQISKQCSNVHLLNTAENGGINPYRTATHVGLLGVK